MAKKTNKSGQGQGNVSEAFRRLGLACAGPKHESVQMRNSQFVWGVWLMLASLLLPLAIPMVIVLAWLPLTIAVLAIHCGVVGWFLIYVAVKIAPKLKPAKVDVQGKLFLRANPGVPIMLGLAALSEGDLPADLARLATDCVGRRVTAKHESSAGSYSIRDKDGEVGTVYLTRASRRPARPSD